MLAIDTSVLTSFLATHPNSNANIVYFLEVVDFLTCTFFETFSDYVFIFYCVMASEQIRLSFTNEGGYKGEQSKF